MLKYNEYISEKLLYDSILESNIIFSKKFVDILNKMENNDEIASKLLSLYQSDIDGLVQNYIDITDRKDTASFVPDRKVKEFEADKPVLWVIDGSRFLTISSRNDNIFQDLGFDKEANQIWKPSNGTACIMLSETTRPSGNTYVLLQEYGDNIDSPRLTIINKASVVLETSLENAKVWSLTKTNIKVGRLVRAILTQAKYNFNDKNIEDFTNLYKATYDITKDALKMFDIVKGDDIEYWYNGERYQDGGGSLNNSCMAHVDDNYFGIYTDNSQVSMIILYGDGGSIKGGKYTSNIIKGRAILWDVKFDNSDTTYKFMDRIYTTFDNDEQLFKMFAEKNGFWYKSQQSIGNYPITNGTEEKRVVITCKIDECQFDYYPYFDTLKYLNTHKSILSNTDGDCSDDDSEDYFDRELQSTDGEYYNR